MMEGLNQMANYLIGKPNVQPLVIREGERPPRFFEGTYTEALEDAKRQFKFLMVYLHSPKHLHTPKFCREVLCQSMVSTFLESHFVFWGGSVENEEAFRISYALGATSFPFFAILFPFSSSSMELLASLGYGTSSQTRGGAVILQTIQGFIPADDLLSHLTDFLENFGPLLVNAKIEIEERQTSRNILQVQNKAYEESLRKDQERAAQLVEEQNRLKMEEIWKEKEKLENEIQELERKKQEEQKKIEEEMKILQLQEKRQLARENLPPEPEKSDSTCTVMVRLSSGRKLCRRFLKTDKLELLFSLVFVEEEILDYNLATHFPKRIFDPSLENRTFEEVGFFPKATLFVDERVHEQ
eukprot:TRINITY_DN462_c0_g2_i12.p1 TRINITY_DN462_c0_g2~~TRINITY_DN462_c0_g2_i12.p1  ORF type:complete len:355 (+),score=94.21 TRINITY_DN462_c0_g2_i12:84-1148(+)